MERCENMIMETEALFFMDRKVADATAISPMASMPRERPQKGDIDIAVMVDQIPGNYLNPMATR